ncbi:MAG: flagellar export chaperone FliS [Magnetococcales bacterium]|nr:flagellar export chaperone FliS [Magnetococcales bacterium]NGZ28095.1 flagellar export chaperone FliS [Magnetococcales bacterium]
MSYGLQRYQKARAETTSREDILLMLYEGAIRFLNQSIVEFEDKGNLAEHKRLLGRGRSIIEEFQNTLDFEKGMEIATNLFELYEYMLYALTQANVTRDMEHVRSVIRVLEILLDGWRGAAKQVKSGSVNLNPLGMRLEGV